MELAVEKANMKKYRKIAVLCMLFFLIIMGGCIYVKHVNECRQYLYKSWFIKEQIKSEEVYGDFSFVITKMNHAGVEGRYAPGGNPLSPVKNTKYRFYGSMEDSAMKCSLWIKEEIVGNMTLEFISENEIKADIVYNADDWEFQKTAVFEPYTINDVKEENPELIFYEDKKVTDEMKKWGTVSIIPGLMNIRHWYPVAYMTDEEGNVLYEFRGGYHNGTTIEEIYIKDFDQDGLKDVEIATHFTLGGGESDIEPIRYIFYQDEGLAFYDEYIEQDLENDVPYVHKYSDWAKSERPQRVSLIYFDEDSIPELLALKDGEYQLYCYDNGEVKELAISDNEVRANAYGPRHQFEEEEKQCFYWFEYVPYKSMMRLHGGNQEERYDYYLRYTDGSVKTELVAKSMNYEWHTYDAEKEIENEEFQKQLTELGYDELVPCRYLLENVNHAYESIAWEQDTKETLEDYVDGRGRGAICHVAYTDEASEVSFVRKHYEELYEEITAGEDWWGKEEYVDFDNDGEDELVLRGYAGSKMFFDVIGDTVYVLLETSSTTDNASVAKLDGKNVIVRTDLLHAGREYYRVMQYDSCGCLIDYFTLSASYEGEDYTQDDEFEYRGRAISMEEYEAMVERIE